MESMDTFMSNGNDTYIHDESLLFQSGLNSTRSLLNEITANTTNMTSFNNRTANLRHKSHNLSTISSSALTAGSPSTLNTNQSGIYTEFKLKTNDYIENTIDLNELIQAYQNICGEHATFLGRYQQQTSQQQATQLRKTNEEQDNLERESQLWHLFNQLYKDELSQRESGLGNDNDDDDDCMAVNNENEPLSSNNYVFKNEAKLADSLITKNSMLRRVRIILNWLEYNAKQNLTQIKNKISSLPEKCTNWEHTLHYLNSTTSQTHHHHHHQSQTRDFVTELDPDAPIRQHKALHDLDQEDEYLLMEFIFSYIRAGDLESAKKLCLKIGHIWRAATFEGFKYFNDYNYMHMKNDEDFNLNKLKMNEGNMNRDLWRLVVSKMIENDSIGPYEKALYGSLAGLVRPVLGVCKTYYDYIWVYFKALFNHLVEKQLRFNISNHDYDRLTLGVDNTIPQTPMQIFDEINTLISTNVHLKAESQKPHSILLKKIILSGLDGFKHNTSELIDYVRTVISTDKYLNNGPFLRFSSHLALTFRFASFDYKTEVYNQIIEHYVQYLIDNKYKELIAFYLSHVPADMQIKYYSKFLQTINNNDERVRLIKLARNVNLNVQAITLNIVENLSKTHDETQDLTLLSTSLAGTSGVAPHTSVANATLGSATFLNKTEFLTFRSAQTLNEDDNKKIDALDWIIHETTQRVKLLEYSNQIMRYFLLVKQNLDAIKIILNKIPSDTLNLILVQYKCKSTDNLSEKIRNIIKEYICFKEYIEAINYFNEWFECYNQKPVKQQVDGDAQSVSTSLLMNSTNASMSFSDRIAFDYQQKVYEDQLNKWNVKTQQFCDKSKKKFYNILTFPNGGWMRDLTASVNGNDDSGSDDAMMDTRGGDGDADGDGEQLRHKQLSALRKLYLPYLCFVLCEMLSKTNLNKELLKLNDLIASDVYRLYELFDVSQLKTILLKSTNASIQLLDTKYDFLGY